MTATLDTQETTAGEIPSFEVTLKVRRFNPEQSDEAFWEEHTLTMYGTDRVLDALHKIMGSRRVADIPSFLRSRDLWFRCDAYQWSQPVGVQGAPQRPQPRKGSHHCGTH